MLQYFGIADAHGLDSFIQWTNLHAKSILTKDREDNKILGSLFIRARANVHRHALVYKVMLEVEDADKIRKLYDAGEYFDALILLKKVAKNIEVQQRRVKSWDLIPNHDIDPY